LVIKVYDVFGMLKKKPQLPGHMPWNSHFFRPTLGPGTGPGSGGGFLLRNLRPRGVIQGHPQ